jgi:ABC-type Fe3+-siderophore transport system permease subunit
MKKHNIFLTKRTPMQKRKHSAIESIVNVSVGYGVALAAQIIFFPVFGINGVPLSKNLGIGAVFTVVSLIRSYALRRIFTRWTE